MHYRRIQIIEIIRGYFNRLFSGSKFLLHFRFYAFSFYNLCMVYKRYITHNIILCICICQWNILLRILRLGRNQCPIRSLFLYFMCKKKQCSLIFQIFANTSSCILTYVLILILLLLLSANNISYLLPFLAQTGFYENYMRFYLQSIFSHVILLKIFVLKNFSARSRTRETHQIALVVWI